MAQIAIPILLLGTAYLISNEKDDEEDMVNESSGQKEGLANLNDVDPRGSLLATEYKKYHPNISKTANNANNEQTVSQYQDKYFLNKANESSEDKTNMFKNLAGEMVKYDDINHNNMNLYYGSKTNGVDSIDTASILDNYTGQGQYDIKKEEIATMFKPQDNMQNVYGNQNQNEFLQSRVNPSNRRANTKPWEEIKVSPGIGKDYDENVSEGFNNYNKNRDLWLPKTVDELRASNNPKNVYCLNDHMGPAINPVTNMGVQGKIVKKNPDSYFVNKDNLGMVAGATGHKKHVKSSEQMLTDENRDTTSVEYYGARGDNNFTYVNGEYVAAHKQQLGSAPITNAVDKETNPASSQNYGKGSYSSHNNNRSTTQTSHYGGMNSTLSSIVQPIINGLRHSKKTNSIINLQTSGSVGMSAKQTKVRSEEIANTTNREMYESSLDMNHLNVQQQQDSAYMNTNPILNATQRNSMNQSEVGPASSHLSGNMSYDAQYNQRNISKVHASNQQSNGNMSLFNNKMTVRHTCNEHTNTRAPSFYDPAPTCYRHPSETLGASTSMPQNYVENSDKQIDSGLLDAFKSNPYTQPLDSAI